jgi:predicted nucleic-acid-binding Zn-ribbon protein
MGGVKCPKCQSHNLKEGELELDGGTVHLDVKCKECGLEWTDQYNLTSIQDPKTGNRFEGTGINEALVLKPGNEGSDYLLKDSHGSVWVEIGNIVAYIRRVNKVDPSDPEKKRTIPEGVAVDLIPTVCAHETLDCCNADFGMAEEHECRKCGEYNGGGEGFDGMCGSCADKAEEERDD